LARPDPGLRRCAGELPTEHHAKKLGFRLAEDVAEDPIPAPSIARSALRPRHAATVPAAAPPMTGGQRLQRPDEHHRPEAGPPCRVGSSVGDIIRAGHAGWAIGILAALRYLERRAGQCVDIAMVDGLFSVLENAVARYVNTGRSPVRWAAPILPSRRFQASRERTAVGDRRHRERQAVGAVLQDPGARGSGRAPEFKTKSPALATTGKPMWRSGKGDGQRRRRGVVPRSLRRRRIPYSPINNLKQNLRGRPTSSIADLVEGRPAGGRKNADLRLAFKLSETPGEVYARPRCWANTPTRFCATSSVITAEQIAKLKTDRGGQHDSLSSMMYQLVADFLVLVHLAFVGFRGQRGTPRPLASIASLDHLPAAAWRPQSSHRLDLPPLTPWRQALRFNRQVGYTGGFIEHYILHALSARTHACRPDSPGLPGDRE